MLQSGKNSWQQDITTAPATYIGTTFYDFAASTVLSSDLQISNYISDITAEVGTPSPAGADQTWYASLDTDMERDPTRVYWKVRGQYDGGTVTRTRLATAVNFAARETTASWPLVKTATQANARADRYLLDISTEEDVITTTIWVHPDHVNDARAGRRIQCRFSHLPGYEDWTWMRILNRTVTWETPEVYRIQYTLSPGTLVTPGGTCTTVVAGMDFYDSGQIGSIGGHNCSPVSVTPTTPADNPAVVIAGIFAQNGQSQLTTGTNAINGTFTSLGAAFGPNGSHTVGEAGYKATTGGSSGAMGVQWSGSDCAEVYRGVAIYVPTAATAPVSGQTGTQVGSGSNITLPNPPTEGNLLVCVRMVETSPFATPGAGFSQVVAGSLSSSSPGTSYIDICVRCVQAGESATVSLEDSSFSHWQYLSEWAIT
jgi:hypothetical protein